MKLWLAAVALCAVAVIGLRARNAGMASGYVDPVGRILAQDEALYAHSALRMAEGHGWLTPLFMERYGLYKPPLLAWTGALGVKLLGRSALAIRLGVVLATALATCLLFLWISSLRGPWAGAAGVLLALSNHLWQVLGGMFLTDGLLAAAIVAALYCVYLDPRLERRGPFYGFAVATAAAVMAKSVAGLMPPLVWLVYALLARREERPRPARIVQCGAATLALVLPWFVYQGVVHTKWFWAEHVQLEILAYGAGVPPQTSQEHRFWFYVRRLAEIDPVLLGAAALGLPWFLMALRRRKSAELLLACWLALVLGAAVAWQYRNASYLLPAVPALALLAAGYIPRRAAPFAALALAAIFVVKARSADRPWGLTFTHDEVPPARALASYCTQRRSADLIIVDPDDSFYATLLPLARVRYCFRMADQPLGRYLLDFRYLGVMVNTREFAGLPAHEATFRVHLREWGLDSSAPIGTVIIAPGHEDVGRLVASRPRSDFLMPELYRPFLPPSPHQVAPAYPGRIFVLSEDPGPPREVNTAACAL